MGLWFGHLMFDTIFSVILTTIIIIVFSATSNQFHGLGQFVRLFLLFTEELNSYLV